MLSSLSINNIQTNFKANVSKNFIKAAHNYYYGVEYNGLKVKFFDHQVRNFGKYGYDDFTIKHEKRHINGKIQHVLFAEKDGTKIILTQKENFRKLLNKFMRLNKIEFNLKMENSSN